MLTHDYIEAGELGFTIQVGELFADTEFGLCRVLVDSPADRRLLFSADALFYPGNC